MAAAILLLGACGSSESDGGPPSTDDVTITTVSDSDPTSPGGTDDPVVTTTTEAADEEPSEGTLTVPDGTEYDLAMYMCDFDGMEDEPRYVLKGYLDDAKLGEEDVEQIDIVFQRTNASGEAYISAVVKGKYADGRQVSYTGRDDAELTVDGNNVSGTVTLAGPGNAPFGPSAEVTLDVTCGALADPPPFN